MDKRARSLAKSVTYRITAFVVLMIITWYVTDNLAQTTIISVTFQAIQLVIYYIHERIWENVNWGKKP
ncbi:MAG: DUF2061 domain-containing protein [Candidatus Bathyarchaeota archaeon]|nr:DUF2061 domain-containing protein [Candidatus Bathyarchaeum sp.]